MAQVSRRKLIASAAAGAATIGVFAGVPALASQKWGKAAKLSATGAAPIMAYVIDPSKGDVMLLVGKKQVTFTDPELVARLVKAAQ